MIEKVLAWYLVSIYTGGSPIQFSPPMVNEQDCLNAKQAIQGSYLRANCVQLNVFLVKNK